MQRLVALLALVVGVSPVAAVQAEAPTVMRTVASGTIDSWT